MLSLYLSFLLPLQAQAGDLLVNGSTGYATLQDAVDAASPGDRIIFRASAPSSGYAIIDVDSNGFVDTFNVYVFLFPRPDQFDLPTFVDGTMTFELLDERERPLVEWLFTVQQVRQARTRPLPGPSHQFQLSLLDAAGTDRYRATRTQMRVTFIPVDGTPVVANGRPTVTIGPTSESRSGR